MNIVFENGLVKVANIITENITAIIGLFQKVQTSELCVDDICVTSEQFRAVFGQDYTTPEPTPESEVETIEE